MKYLCTLSKKKCLHKKKKKNLRVITENRNMFWLKQREYKNNNNNIVFREKWLPLSKTKAWDTIYSQSFILLCYFGFKVPSCIQLKMTSLNRNFFKDILDSQLNKKCICFTTVYFRV